MARGPAVLILDDGELDDVQAILEGMGVPFGRVRGGAIVKGTVPPRDLLVSTPRRIDAVGEVIDPMCAPVRMVVVNEDSNALREQLRRVGFDFLVRRPVHPEALRLLVEHCLYRGEERRSEPRVAVGFEVSFRAGVMTRRATLADLSIRGCRLLSHLKLEANRRIRVQIPEALETGDPISLKGRVVRVSDAKNEDSGEPYAIAVAFERLADDARDALELIIEDRAHGPATLRPSSNHTAPSAETTDTEDLATPEDANDSASAAPRREAPGPERRNNRRGAYTQTVPAFGNRALRVLVGRDLSVGGMRIERLPGLELGDRLHLAIYGDPGDPPFLIWGSVSRDDGDGGMGVVFDPVEPALSDTLERLVGALPAVEDLHDTEVEAMGTVLSEILES